MSFRRAACAVVATIVLGAGAVGSSVAVTLDSGDDGDGKPSWKKKTDDRVKSPKADQIAVDRLGDADRGVDIQSLAIFNREDLDYVGLAVTGRDFRLQAKRSIEVFFGTGKKADKPRFRLVAKNDGRTDDARAVRLYRVNGWRDDGKRVKCESLRVQFDIQSQSQIRIAVPRTCIGGRKGVSVNATVADTSASRGAKSGREVTDVVPGERELSRRVH